MATLNYRITFYSDWHTGSGLTSGSDLDALVIKDRNDLPFIPGKTLKGLFKEAAVEMSRLAGPVFFNDGFIQDVFGFWDDNIADEKLFPERGAAFFSNAELPEVLKEEISRCFLQPFLYRAVSSTAIEGGVAKQGSLRRTQVTVPCDLYAEVRDIDEKYVGDLRKCCGWIKRLGLNRHRGLGRCDFEFVE